MSDWQDDWEEVALGDVAEIINGRAYKLSEWETSGNPVIRLQNLTQRGGVFYFSNLVLPEKQYCTKGDLLYMWSATFGPHIWWGEKAIFHYHIWKIEPNERIDKRFLFYLLDAKTQEWKTAGSGMAMIHLTKAGIEKELLSVPPLPEQKKIAEILSGIDSAIAKLKWKARKLDSLQFSLTEEFAQELNGKGEPSALEENAEIRTGVAKNSNTEGDMVEMPYMRVANVQDGYLDLSEIKTISIDRGKVKRYLLHKGDVLINEGGDLDKVGRGVIWHEEIKECLHQNHVFAVRCSERLMPEFLSLYLKSSHSKNYFLGCAKQTTNLASINSTQLKSFPIPVPELSVQEKFIERITSTKDLSFAIATEISGLGAIKKAISGDLLSGRKRVSI